MDDDQKDEQIKMNKSPNQQQPSDHPKKSGMELQAIQEAIQKLQHEQQNQNTQLSNVENENKSLKTQQDSIQNELQNIKQNITKLTQENKTLKQEISGIKSKLQEIDGNNNSNEEEKEPLDELKDFLTNIKYKVQLPDYYDVLKEEGFDDMEMLKEIKDEDLLDVGIKKKAHRMRIIRGITILNAGNNINNGSDNEANMAAPAANDYVEGAHVVITKR